ncbi:MAG TPA: M48 family metallopeptidase [Ktedonobacterales bacterium]|nr:M48 family metallopeptidase [Ktedonobacterales bacterium]
MLNRHAMRPAAARVPLPFPHFATEAVGPSGIAPEPAPEAISDVGSEPAPEGLAPEEPATLDTARQAEARRYARQRQALSLLGLGATAAVVAIFLFTGLNFWLRDALAFVPAWSPAWGWQPLRVGAYALALLLAAFVLGLPLGYYSGHILPRRYGLSTQTRAAWALDELKGLALSLVLEVVAVVAVYALLAASPDLWWLWAGIGMLFFTVLLANLAPILLLPLFYKLTPLPDGDVKRRALALAERARTRVRGIYAMKMSEKTTAANAMVMGLGNTRRIIIGDTLLDHYTPDEVEVVVAHELGHQVHRDIPKLVAMQTVTTLGGLYIASLALAAILSADPRYHGLADPATLPLLGVALGVFGLVTMPLVNGVSRWVEAQADIYALETTGKTEAFISAMTRLANQNLAELEPAPWVEFLLYNHPSIGKRLALGRAYAAKQEAAARP